MKSILNLRLSESDNGKLVSILELPGDVLIIPQATLGGRVKGKMIQYHGNVEKAVGEVLYEEFTKTCQQTVAESRLNDASGIVSNVKWGTYGNRQVLTLDTNGPFTHLIEF